MENYLSFLLCLLQLVSSIVASEETDSCLLYFTVQPPFSLPCNPYHSTLNNDNSFSLQCIVHAPELSSELPDQNFTLEWVRTFDGSEETIGVVSHPAGYHVDNQISPYFYDSSSSPTMGSYVKSTLTVDPERVSSDKITGTYWCRVLLKTRENYSYSVAGRSNTQTVVPSQEEFSELNHYPPCVQGLGVAFHQSHYKCVYDKDIIMPSSSPSSGDAILVTRGALAAISVIGGVLFVVMLILTLVVVYLCRVVNEKKPRSEGMNRASMQSTDTQEEDYARKASPNPIISSQSQPHPQLHPQSHSQPHLQSYPQPYLQSHPQPHPLGYGRQNSSYRAVKQKPYIQGNHSHPRQQHIHSNHQHSGSFSNDTAAVFFSGRIKSTAGSSNSMNL